jgi:prepilin-type N-terminal cleavage/methylation domain-containing protein
VNRRAFTLVELLVVVAIVALLAAIIVPILSKAKASAKYATSVSNMRQIGQAISIYASSYDDIQPLASNPNTIRTVLEGSPRYGQPFDSRRSLLLISEVLQIDKRIFRAPYDPGPQSGDPLTNTDAWIYNNLGNRWISYSYAEWPAIALIPMTAVPSPSQKVLLNEPVSIARNPRIESKRNACLFYDLSVRVETSGICNESWPEPN